MKCDHEFDAACLRCCQNKIVEVVALTERATAAGEKHAKEVERLRAENAELRARKPDDVASGKRLFCDMCNDEWVADGKRCACCLLPFGAGT